MLNWRKTPVWGKGLCLLLCGVLLAACAGNPGETVSGGDVLLTEPANPQLEAYDREKDELGQELDRLQNRFQEATRPVTELPNAVVAKMELTAYANMEVSLPADWAYTLVDYTGGEEPCGIRFWPKECPGAAMGLYYYPQGFGICGNETMTVAMQVDENGEIVNLIGTLGYENGSDCILFCSYSEYFAAVSEGISNFPEYQKDLLGILGSVVLNRGGLTEQEALECLRKQSLIREDWDVYQCKYDPQTGEWCFRFYAEESDSNPQKELYVGPDGTCRYAGERHRESGHHHGH